MMMNGGVVKQRWRGEVWESRVLKTAEPKTDLHQIQKIESIKTKERKEMIKKFLHRGVKRYMGEFRKYVALKKFVSIRKRVKWKEKKCIMGGA